MIESLSQIRMVASDKWKFWLWLPQWRRIVLELVQQLEDVPTRDELTRNRIHALELDLSAWKAKAERLPVMEQSAERANELQVLAQGEQRRAEVELEVANQRCQRLEQESEKSREERFAAERALTIKEAELEAARTQIDELKSKVEKSNRGGELLANWIKTTHRLGDVPPADTIKRILHNAQQRQ